MQRVKHYRVDSQFLNMFLLNTFLLDTNFNKCIIGFLNQLLDRISTNIMLDFQIKQ